MAKSVLTSSAFTFVGAFQMPTTVGTGSTDWGQALTHRYIGSQLVLISNPMTGDCQTFGFGVPTLRLTPPWNVATVSYNWGNVQGTKAYLEEAGSAGAGAMGLWWDDVDQRLYWAFQYYYNAQHGNDNCFGFSTLRDNGLSGSATAYGAWKMGASIGCKAVKGFCPIPADFANAYCGGKRIGIGGGGYESVATVGPASMGPALFAIAPPPTTYPERTDVPAPTKLLNYPFNATPYTSPWRAQRDANYTTEFDGWNPRNGIGYFTWVDILRQSFVWIDLPTKHGVLFIPRLGNGRVWYESSSVNATSGSHAFMVYDPADLARVAQGQVAPDAVNPAQYWPYQFAGISYPFGGWRDEGPLVADGVTFDATASRLYVRLRLAYRPAGDSADHSVIYVFQVA